METLKNDFISVISHEVRTPLTSIHGALNCSRAASGASSIPRASACWTPRYRNSQRLVRLVNDLLDLQRIESGTMTFNLRPVDLRSLLEQAVEASQAHAGQLGIKLPSFRTAPAGARVRVDSDRIMQVMTNLLSNAAKFSPRAETVVVEASRQNAGSGWGSRTADRECRRSSTSASSRVRPGRLLRSRRLGSRLEHHQGDRRAHERPVSDSRASPGARRSISTFPSGDARSPGKRPRKTRGPPAAETHSSRRG